MKKQFKAWLSATGRAAYDNEETECPSCLQGHVRYQFVGDPETRIGYLTSWCDRCFRGIYVSRVGIPERADMLAFGVSPETLKEKLPEKIEYVKP